MEKALRLELLGFILAILILSGCSALTPSPDSAQNTSEKNDSILAMDYEEEDDNFD